MKHTRCASGDAHHRVRVARQVAELEETAAAWAAGEVTTKHVGPEHCEGHHLDEWERDDGPTDLDNGALFCNGHCHRQLHEDGWTVVGDPNGELKFYDRSGHFIGSSLPHQPAPPIKTKRRRNRHTDRLTRERVRLLQHAREARARGGEVAAAG